MNFFMFRKRAIRYSPMAVKNYDIHIFEDILLRAMEENEYHFLIDAWKKP